LPFDYAGFDRTVSYLRQEIKTIAIYLIHIPGLLCIIPKSMLYKKKSVVFTSHQNILTCFISAAFSF